MDKVTKISIAFIAQERAKESPGQSPKDIQSDPNNKIQNNPRILLHLLSKSFIIYSQEVVNYEKEVN